MPVTNSTLEIKPYADAHRVRKARRRRVIDVLVTAVALVLAFLSHHTVADDRLAVVYLVAAGLHGLDAALTGMRLSATHPLPGPESR